MFGRIKKYTEEDMQERRFLTFMRAQFTSQILVQPTFW